MLKLICWRINLFNPLTFNFKTGCDFTFDTLLCLFVKFFCNETLAYVMIDFEKFIKN